MPLILVAGEPEAGATTVAVALAQRLARLGRPARLERLAGDERAEGDAAVFAAIEFASSSGAPIEPDAPDARDAITAGDDVVVLEAPSGADGAVLAGQLGARLVSVTRAIEGEAAAAANGRLPLRTHTRRGGALALPEDRLLAAPTVAALIAASGAQVLAQSIEGAAAICEHIVIGAIAPDFADQYFKRFPRSAVVTRAEKVDVALAALRTDPECLILSGGGEPSPYLLDRVASARRTTLLLAPQGTVETARAIEGSFGRSPFSGEAKIERAGELLAAALDDSAIEALLDG